MSKISNVSKDMLEKVVANSSSLTEICRKIGYLGFRASVLELIKKYNIDISHLKGKGWKKDLYDWDKFKYGKVISSAMMLPSLIYKRGHKCENCGLSEWMNEKIPLEVHHVDGDKLNNNEDNLLLLCPNCHSMTKNFRGKNSRRNTNVSDEDFVKALSESKNIRQALLRLNLTPKGANYSRARNLAVTYNIKHILEP